MNNDSQSPADSRQSGNGQPSAQEQADTTRSLQQASAALELASSRIRQVRRSLLQLSESLPSSQEAISRIGAYEELRPAHDALLLTGADGVQRPTSVRAERRRRNAPNLLDNGPMPPAQPLSTLSPPTQPATQIPSGGTLSSRPDILLSMLNADPSATTLGVRVAAREALSAHQNEGAPPSTGIHWTSQDSAPPDPFYADIQARYERLRNLQDVRNVYDDFQHIDDLLRPPESFRTAVERVGARRWGPLVPLNIESPTTSTLHSNPLAGPSQPNDDPHSGQSTDFQPNAAGPSLRDRLLATGMGLAEEHRQILQDVLLADYPPLSPEFRSGSPSWPPSRPVAVGQTSVVVASTPDGQAYDGEEASLERVMSIYRSSLAGGPGNIEIRYPSSQTEGQPVPSLENGAPAAIERTTRRAWARLDADGDEIPSNEEEELERERTSYRLRAQQLARQQLPAGQVDSARSFARLDGPRDMPGSVIDSTRTVPDVRRQQQRAPPIPINAPVSAEVKDSYVNPLPMPLESMVMDADTEKEEEIYIDIVFPKNAYIAGR